MWKASCILFKDESRMINLYIPSKRMRNLLEQWLNDEFEGESNE